MTTQVEVIKNLLYQGLVANGGWILNRKWWGLQDGSRHPTSFPSIPEYVATDNYQRSYVKRNIGHWSRRIPHDTLYLALPTGKAFAEMIYEDHIATTSSSSSPTTTTTSDSFQILVTLTMDLVTIIDKGRTLFPRHSLEIQQDRLVLTGCATLPVHDLRGVE